MLFALLPYAPRLRAVLLGVAFAFSGWCHGQTVPDLRVLETGPGLFELIWNDAGENWVLETSPDLGSSEPWLLFSELPALNNGFYSVPVEGLPAPQFFRLRQDEPDPIDPDAPVYEPLPDQAVFPGETLTFAIRAVDPNGLRVTYLVENLPLPQGALLNTSTGAFTFTPTESQIGTHPIIFLATNGIQTSRLRVNVLVQQPQGPSTSLSGILLDTTDAVNGTSTPIRGATIALLGTGVTTTTGADGRFTLNDTPAGLQVIDMDTSTADLAPDGSPYAGFREAIRIVANLDNVVERPFYLPRIERASLTKTEPNFTTTVRNERLGITLTVPPHTAMREGEEFEGDLSISEVPESLAPANLPDFLDPALLITIQPVGVRFNDPVPVTFPNIDDLAPGSETDIWSLDPDRGIFTVVGTGRVTEDGQFIETIRGGVIAADWHATLPPAPPTSPPPPPPCPDCCPAGGFGPSGSGSGAGPSGPAPFGGLSWNDPEFRESSPWIWGRPWDFGDGTRGLPREDPWTPAADSATTLYAGALPDAGASLIQFSSQASPATGTLMTQFSTPATVEAGASRQITFNYRSDWAFPHSAIPVDGTILFQSAVPRTISYDYILGGMMEDREVYASTTGFSENRDEPFRFVATFSTQALPTGLYPYTIRLHSNFAFSTRSTAVSGLFANVHADENGLGHGWGIAGLQRIHADWDSGRLMVVDGGGTISLFSDSVANSTFVVGGFSANRAADFSFTEGAHYSDARAFLQQTFPFLEMASFAELTTASLAGIDILILNPLAGSTVGNPLPMPSRRHSCNSSRREDRLS